MAGASPPWPECPASRSSTTWARPEAGVWKTTNGGIEWAPITDGQVKTGSVGAIAVAPSDPNVVYVGMGESCIRGNVSHGDGVYRSTDAGKTWTHVGLRDTMQIGRIRVHPQDPDHVYVAALGHTWGPHAERGVFRSRDGGKTWSKSLFVDDKTGVVDLAMDPANPRVLYAAAWQAQRTPWSLESGGPGSALHKTTDGGDTWKKLDGKGLPKGPWGRIGVSVSPARSERVYAVIEAEDGGVFRSDDSGATWERTNEDRKLRQRAWYYTHVVADPKEPDTVYVLNVQFFRSKDGGKTFETIRVPHGDNHDLWIAPEDPRRMVEGNDGGAAVTFDGGLSWSSVENQPTAQFYHVIADDQFPYRVYGAQQDNSTVSHREPHRRLRHRRARLARRGRLRERLHRAEARRPRRDLRRLLRRLHRPARPPHRPGAVDRRVARQPDGLGRRGNEVPLPVDVPDRGLAPRPGRPLRRRQRPLPHDERRLELGGRLPRPHAQRRLEDGAVGRPVTKDNTSVEYYGTIFALAESPLDGEVLWAGSDDGLVHVTRDGGKTWSNVTPKAMPEWSRVSQIDASPHDAGTAWVAANRYQLDDYRPYVYVTTDFGATWRLAVTGLPADSFVRVVREDPKRRGLLFAGTETGVHVSFDAGASWRPLQRNLPAVPVTDLVVKDDDVVARDPGPLVLDPRRHRAAAAAHPGGRGRRHHLFEPSVAYRFGGAEGRGAVGKNPPYGARFYYLLKDAPKDGEEVKLEILDEKGALVRAFTSKEPKKAEAKGGGRGRRLGQGRAEADPGEGGAQHLRLGPAHPARREVRGHDPLGRRDGRPPRGARGGTRCGSARAERPSPGRSSCARTRASPPPTRTSRSSSPCSRRSATS